MATPIQIKKLHSLKSALKMDDDTYRSHLSGYGVKSSKDRRFTIAKADAMIVDLEQDAIAMGVWEKRKPGKRAKATRPLADDAQSKKIRQLWLELHAEGKVVDPSEKALASYVKRMERVDALQWLTVAKASRLIEKMKKWLER